MRIDRLDLLAYGHFRDLCVDLSTPAAGLTVVIGPNEAGKSTAMRAIDALLFGIERGADDHFGAGRAALRVGACLSNGDGTTVEIVRQGLAKAPLVGADGGLVDADSLAHLLGGVERPLFRALFSIGHAELTDRSEDLLDTDAEIGRLVFGAGLGSTSLSVVLRRLEDRRDALFKKGARAQNPAVNAAIGVYRDLVKGARDLRVRSRAWEVLDHERQDKITAIDKLQNDLVLLRARRQRLDRLVAALPLLDRHRDAKDRLERLRDEGPVPPAAWAVAYDGARAEVEQASEDLKREAGQKKAIENQLVQLDIPEDLLMAQDRVNGLVERTGRYRKDCQDLPKREQELDQHQVIIRSHLKHLGVSPDAPNITLTPAQEHRIGELAAEHPRIAGSVQSATKEALDVDSKAAVLRRELEELPDVLDVSALERISRTAESVVSAPAELADARAERSTLESEATALLGRLGLARHTPAQAERLTVPPRARIESEREARLAIAGRWAALNAQRSTLNAARARLTAELLEVECAGNVPRLDELTAARAHRDTGWRLVRSAWLGEGLPDGDADAGAWACDMPLDVAYEAAVNDADAVADHLRNDADRVVRFARIEAEIHQLDDDERALAGERKILEDEEVELDATWQKVWAHLGIEVRDTTEMVEWREEHQGFLRIASKLHEVDSKINRLDDQIAEQAVALSVALAGIRKDPDQGGLIALVRQSRDVIQLANDSTLHRRTLEEALRTCESERPARRTALDKALSELAAWQKSWAGSLVPLGLGAETSPQGADRTLTLVRELRSEERAAAELETRIRGIRDDIAAYEHDVGMMVADLAPELAQEAPLVAVCHLKERLDVARGDRKLQDDLTAKREAVVARLADAKQRLDEWQSRIERLAIDVGVDSPSELPAAAQRAVQAAKIEESIAEIESALIEAGSGATFAEIRAEASAEGCDADQLRAELERIADDLENRESALGDVRETLGRLCKEIDGIDGSDAAAATEQQAEEALADLAGHVEEYARIAVASVLLDRVIADYGCRHQRPVLDRAAVTFAKLTGDAFAGLVVDVDSSGRQMLLAKRRNGDLLGISALSDGTRDQLYLALRLAGVEHHLDNATPLPLILDDLLVNFDDDRTGAGLDVLADLGKRTQVLLFTHHEHLVEMARRQLANDQLSIVRLRTRGEPISTEASL